MKFDITKLSKSSGRLGNLIQSETGKQFKTPLLLQTTKGGSIPYLSREVFDYVSKEPQLMQMTLATMNQMTESLTHFNGSLASYVGFQGYPTMLFIRDPCETIPSGGNDRDIVPIFTRHGKESLTPERYMEVVESFVPDIYQGLCDADTNLDSAKKRIKKSVDRTEKFMDYCYEQQAKSSKLSKSALFAPIVGGYCPFARTDSIAHAHRSGATSCSGYVLEGFHNYGLSATTLQPTQMTKIVSHCISQMEVEKPRVMPGAYNPLMLLTLIRLGVDMFDSSYPYCAAVNFKALIFSFDLTQNAPATPFLDLTDDSIKEDFAPFLRSCDCLACRKHTRAYVHHLYKTKELLGPILLMVHNLHHFMNFFGTIRRCIEADELPKLIELLELQNTSKTVDYHIEVNTKVIGKTAIGKGFVAAPI